MALTSPDKTASVAFQPNGIYTGLVTRVDVANQRVWVMIPRVANGFQFGPLTVLSTDLPAVNDRVGCMFVENRTDDVVVLGSIKSSTSPVYSSPIICTFASRPDSPSVGTIIYETDTEDSYVWNGASWVGFGGSGEGTQGPQGFQGVQGTQGPQGFQGAQGLASTVAGPQGFQGTQGFQGNQGFQGLASTVAGPQGNQGNQGFQGHQGFQGTTGVTGTQGATILSGSVNPTSGIGSDGDFFINTVSAEIFGPKTSGSWAVDGLELVGPQGAQGAQGLRGFQGFQGAQGFQGNQGFQGTQGVQGFQGTQGVAGPQGFQGVQGAQGPQGGGVPVAGTINQLLKKNSSTDYDTSWTSALTVDSIAMSSAGTKKITTTGTELILEQTGDVYGATSLKLQNRDGANGAIFSSRLFMGLVDFGFYGGNLYQSNLRLETRDGGGVKGGPSASYGTVTEFQFIDNTTGAFSIYFVSNKLATVIRAGKFGIGVDDPLAMSHIKASTSSTIAEIVQGTASQSANLSEWRDNSGAILAKVTSSGELQATVIDGGSA